MRLKTSPSAEPKESGVITKATLRAAEKLGIRNNVLAKIVGVSEPTVSRMRKGEYVLERGQKAFELAILFVRFYRSLDAIVGGDEAVASDWIKNSNAALDSKPIDLIQTVAGLANVIAYLDSRRAVV
ncbi:MAG: MbcA/ParS/Xre antitoxin family protein [Pseudolabrys sp.]|nr:MbcA/ParS/Xre antitoxin family protein [Pseudolabrys sp.]